MTEYREAGIGCGEAIASGAFLACIVIALLTLPVWLPAELGARIARKLRGRKEEGEEGETK